MFKRPTKILQVMTQKKCFLPDVFSDIPQLGDDVVAGQQTERSSVPFPGRVVTRTEGSSALFPGKVVVFSMTTHNVEITSVVPLIVV